MRYFGKYCVVISRDLCSFSQDSHRGGPRLLLSMRFISTTSRSRTLRRWMCPFPFAGHNCDVSQKVSVSWWQKKRRLNRRDGKVEKLDAASPVNWITQVGDEVWISTSFSGGLRFRRSPPSLVEQTVIAKLLIPLLDPAHRPVGHLRFLPPPSR